MRASAVAAFLASVLVVEVVCAGPASAAPGPVWSGLDTRTWSAPVPAPGVPTATVPLDPAVSLTGAGRAVRTAYGTVDQHGKPAIATAAVFLPRGTPPPGGWPILAWAHGTVGLGDDCAPSTRPRSARDATYLDHWLDQGYAVVAADYAGLGSPGLHSYLDGRTAARGIVDAVVAARAEGLPLAATWAVVGQSQGAAAALNTAVRASPLGASAGLDFRGTVATGAPANTEHVLRFLSPWIPPIPLPKALTTYTLYILAGFREKYPEAGINALLTPRGRELVDAAEHLCLREFTDSLGDVHLSGILTRPLWEVPGILGMLTEYMATPATGYDRPVFLGQGLLDIDVPAPSALTLAAQMAVAAQPVELHVYPDQDHSGTVGAATADATAFLARVMRKN